MSVETEEERTARFGAATKELLRYATEARIVHRPQVFETRRIHEEGPFFLSVYTARTKEIRTLLRPLADEDGLTKETQRYLDQSWRPGDLWAVTRAGMEQGGIDIEEEVEGGWTCWSLDEDYDEGDKAVREFTGMDERDLGDLLGLIAFRASLQWGEYQHLSSVGAGAQVLDGQIRAAAFRL
jgi:hypothetical protein